MTCPVSHTPRALFTAISLLACGLWTVAVTANDGEDDAPTAYAEVYINNTIEQLKLSDFLTGLLKAATFGTLLSTIACFNGLKVTGGAAGVGKATTDTVVQTVVLIIVADMIFGVVFLRLGWT